MNFFNRFIQSIVALPRSAKKALALALDGVLCALATWLAFYLRLNFWVSIDRHWIASLGSILLALPLFSAFGLYRTVFRFVGWEALTRIVQAVFVYGALYFLIFTLFAVPGVPRTIGIIQPILLLIGVCGSRAAARYWLSGDYRARVRGNKRNVLIYGAGSAGRQLAAAMTHSGLLRVAGFVDDDRHLQGTRVAGIPVCGPEMLDRVVNSQGITEVLLAIPSASRTRRNQILEMIRAAGMAVRTLPDLMDIAHGKVTTSDLRSLEVDDLLGREAIKPDARSTEQGIRGKVVMVTGAGGSIGSELCRQIAQLGPARLLLVDISEYALYSVHHELGWLDDDAAEDQRLLVPLLGSVCDTARMRRIYETWRPQIVFHAAAYKHVPLVEHNVAEGVRNNVLGTRACANLAQEHGVERFILVSTDKAVRPTNVMGASKRLAELVMQALAAESSTTCFSIVRFGNVLGSSGSVVPLFRQQIAGGGPITVTHPEVIRYFMTIPEAAQLVLQASVMAQGGEVFVLDMGEPVRIVDLAVRMIELSGLKVRSPDEPNGDIEIVFSGLRPGEKLYEELLIGDNPAPTSHPRIMTASEQFIPAAQLAPSLDALAGMIARADTDGVRAQLVRLVDGFKPRQGNVDWVALEQARPGEARETHVDGNPDHLAMLRR